MSELVEAEEESPTLALVIALLIGLVVRSISSFIPQRWRFFPLPYTAVILIIGVVVGVITDKTTGVAYASDSLRSLEGISPSTLFTVFLPALIIPSGLSLHWHVVKRVLGKALLLAVFGTLFNAGITALVFKFIFPYSWPWSGCLLLAAVLAATDPVAVVAIMQSVGASRKLSTIIEGESLLNDGVAYVLFEIFRRWAIGENLTAGGIVGFVFKASVGGPLLGLVWAAVLILWVAITFNDAILEITMSLVAGYALWLVSDEMLGLSGILSLVFFATALGAYGKLRISRSVDTSFEFFWEWVDWLANTLIFFLSGLITALELLRVATITKSDWAWAVALWLFLIAIRTVMVVIFYPLLRLGQYGISWKDGIVLSWSGLRGAVGLTLALIIYYSDDVLDTEYRERFFFFMSFIAFITLVIQGSTTSVLLKWLGYLDLTPAMKSAMMHAAGAVDRLGAAKIAAAKKAPSLLGDASWKKVKTYTKLDVADRVVKRSKAGRKGGDPHVGGGIASTAKKKRRRQQRAGMKHNRDNTAAADVFMKEDGEMKTSYIYDMRERLLQMVMACYKDAFSANYLSPDEFLTLYESAEKSLDIIEDEPLPDWSFLKEKLTNLETFEKLIEVHSGDSAEGTGSLLKTKKIWQKLKEFFVSATKEARFDAEKVHTYVCAHAQARRELKMYIDIEFGVRTPNSNKDAAAARNTTTTKFALNNDDLEAGNPPATRTNDVDGKSSGNNGKTRSAAAAAVANTLPPAPASKQTSKQPRGDDIHMYWREDQHNIHATGATNGTNANNTTTSTTLLPRGATTDGEEQGMSSVLDSHASELIRSLSTIQRMTTRDKNQAQNVEEALTQVLEESQVEQAHAEAHLQRLKELCPKAVQSLRTAHVSMHVLKKESEFLERLHDMGLLQEREVEPVLKQIERRIQRLNLADYESLPFLKPEPEED
jgi:NhaP-type Na+/H+ or K+/H+ antiporter